MRFPWWFWLLMVLAVVLGAYEFYSGYTAGGG